ncbi:MAG: replication factor C small subunit [Methanocellales archaeon]|nr:replication factor C small subunit [Methanocellales archaeon]
MIKEEIWTEKYRPETLGEVVGQDDITERLKSYVKSGNLPHLLFSGPAGVGKTASAIAIAKELFGEAWINNFTELNASDERGIDVVRNQIKNFARTSPLGDASFKIIFLDEADALTPDAQNALRRTMERFSATCRFILSCNYSSKIIEPIQSRCSVYRFRPISDGAIEKRIKYIASEEKLKVTEDGLDAIKYVARGDMRRAINALQAAAVLGKKIDAEVIYKIATMARPEEINELIEFALGGDFMGARDKLDVLLIEQGLSGEDVINQIHRAIMDFGGISEKTRVQLLDKIGEIDFRLTEGANERIQLEALIAHFMLAGSKE